MYRTERDKVVARDFADGFDEVAAGRGLRASTCSAAPTDHVLELTPADRRRIFNLGYFTWVEQQGVPFDEFVERARARRSGPRCAPSCRSGTS